MAVGLRVRNQGTGQIQIGAGYRNLQLAKSGTLNTGSFSGGSTGGSPPFASWSPRGALASTNGTTNLHVCRYINDAVSTNTGFSLVQSGVTCDVYASSAAPNKTLEYYTFSAAERAASGPVGLRMRGEDGTVFYDSRRKGLRVLQVVALPAVSGPPIEVGQFFPGIKIGIAIPSPRFYYNSPSQDRCTMTADYFHMTSDNRIFISRLQTVQQTLISNTFPVGGVTMGPQNATIFIVDLTEVPLGFG
ncbi:hypothetical protein E4417_06995 [Stenotrophomonas maltophilia]|uniref:hypothetical protein n=1 Tax=Stenotrophomonas maltophilia TaxID=40324 RepID=UPI0010945D9C|nr:hypothetical protein [Stenotrophomonas maltophilia]TGW21104.1 hypothetical protein E4417_06995 [Stenotrophomonas maltophilia]